MLLLFVGVDTSSPTHAITSNSHKLGLPSLEGFLLSTLNERESGYVRSSALEGSPKPNLASGFLPPALRSQIPNTKYQPKEGEDNQM